MVEQSMDLFITNDPRLPRPQHEAMALHVRDCARCARSHEAGRWLIGLLRQHWPYEAQNDTWVRRLHDPRLARDVTAGGWHDLQRRIPELSRTGRCPPMRHLVSRAAAACLVLGFLGLSLRLGIRGSSELAESPRPAAEVPVIAIEQLAGHERLKIASGSPIRTQDTGKILLIDGKHRVVMNRGTTVNITPCAAGTLYGCMVTLAVGEIFAHVQHDGRPFTVETPHGSAVVVGTSFSVKATEDMTTLVVTDGTVRYGSEEGWVEVKAGQVSFKTAVMPPSSPVARDVGTRVAWAAVVEIALSPPPAQTGDEDYDLTDVRLGAVPAHMNLEGMDFQQWADNERDWFRRQFPWIFDLERALSGQGINVNYPELLVLSGDIWQFTYLDERPAQFSWLNPNSLLAASRHYGFDWQWLLQHVPAVRDARKRPGPSIPGPTGLRGLEQWLSDPRQARELELPESLHSYHAAQYLVQTRTLTWFAIRDGRCKVPEGPQRQVLELLHKIVAAASEWQCHELCWPEAGSLFSCNGLESDRTRTKTELAGIIYACENKLADYQRAGLLTLR